MKTEALFLFALLALVAPAVAEEDNAAERPPGAGEEGYRIDVADRRIGGPTDVETDLDLSFPRPDSLFPGLIPKGWFEWKERLYEERGIKLGASYQSLYQHASDTLTGTDHAWGGWLLVEAKWEAINRGEDYEGSLTAAFDWRHTISGSQPTFFGLVDVGSLWPTDFAFFELDPALTILYWEQWFDKDRFVVRAGKQLAVQYYDFFRFKDSRSSFTASPFTFHTSIPSPPFGQALSFEWWPQEGSELYVVGTLNDMNGDPESFGLDTAFDGQYFYGIEIGYFWKRNGLRDFDHVHVDLFYADRRQNPGPFPNEPGGGVKVLGSKQMERVVVFGSYTYNTAEGGGFGVTFARHTVTAGVALLKPAGIRGEAALGLAWKDPIDPALRDQFGGEVYWKLLLTPDLWITPGFQFIFNPSFNPTTDFVVIVQFKFRLFF